MSKLGSIQALVRNGLFYLTEHAREEAAEEDLDIYDVEYALQNGRMRRTWPKDEKYEIIGRALDGRALGVVCRFTLSGKLRVITVYEDDSL